MRKIYLLLFIPFLSHAAEKKDTHNTYGGVPITPNSLLELARAMPKDLKEETDAWMAAYKKLVSRLVTTPHPLTHESRKQKTKDNFALIKEYENKQKVTNLSTFNYVLHFAKHKGFVVPINRWGSRIAYLVFATDQGNVLDEDFKPDFDCSKFEYMPSYQHCSRLAHYLRFKEIQEKEGFENLKAVPTYLKHIPGKPSTLSDENYVPIQLWIKNYKEIKHLPEKEQIIVIKNIPLKALKEMYVAIKYAATWDMAANLAIIHDGDPKNLAIKNRNYYFGDLEEPFNHKPQFFYFQGEEGKKKYVMDVIDGLERMAVRLKCEPKQFERWQKLTDKDHAFLALCKQYGRLPNFEKPGFR